LRFLLLAIFFVGCSNFSYNRLLERIERRIDIEKLDEAFATGGYESFIESFWLQQNIRIPMRSVNERIVTLGLKEEVKQMLSNEKGILFLLDAVLSREDNISRVAAQILWSVDIAKHKETIAYAVRKCARRLKCYLLFFENNNYPVERLAIRRVAAISGSVELLPYLIFSTHDHHDCGVLSLYVTESTPRDELLLILSRMAFLHRTLFLQDAQGQVYTREGRSLIASAAARAIANHSSFELREVRLSLTDESACRFLTNLVRLLYNRHNGLLASVLSIYAPSQYFAFTLYGLLTSPEKSHYGQHDDVIIGLQNMLPEKVSLVRTSDEKTFLKALLANWDGIFSVLGKQVLPRDLSLPNAGCCRSG